MNKSLSFAVLGIFSITASLDAQEIVFHPNGETDVTPLVRKAIESMKPGDTLRFEKGEYHFYPEQAKRVWVNPSNNLTGEKRVAFPLNNLTDATVDGGESTFVWHGCLFPFEATNTVGLTVKNLNMRTMYKQMAPFTVLEKSDEGFLIEFGEGVCPYYVKDGGIFFKFDNDEIGTATQRLSFHATRRFHVSFLFAGETTASLKNIPGVAIRANAELREGRKVYFRYRTDDTRHKFGKCPYNIGEPVLFNLAEMRERLGLFFRDCENVRVENVRIERGAGMGLVAQVCKNVTLDGFRVVPLPGERVSITADAMQVINCQGEVLIQNCETSSMLDDVIDVHGNYLLVCRTEGNKARLKIGHRSHNGFFPYRPGDSLEFVDARTRKLFLTARVKGLSDVSDDLESVTLETDTDLSSLPKSGVLVDNVTLIPDSVTLRNNYFHDSFNMRFSGRSKWLIEKNRIEKCLSILCLDLQGYWSESGPIRDMTIRDNDIISSGSVIIGLSGWHQTDKNVPQIHDKIVIEDNRFVGMGTDRIKASGVKNLILRNNTYK